jgi:hypothetical protein
MAQPFDRKDPKQVPPHPNIANRLIKREIPPRPSAAAMQAALEKRLTRRMQSGFVAEERLTAPVALTARVTIEQAMDKKRAPKNSTRALLERSSLSAAKPSRPSTRPGLEKAPVPKASDCSVAVIIAPQASIDGYKIRPTSDSDTCLANLPSGRHVRTDSGSSSASEHDATTLNVGGAMTPVSSSASLLSTSSLSSSSSSSSS